jgi:hypothetical protein
MASETGNIHRDVLDRWRSILLNAVLKKLPERIRRGFAPDEPEFEDLVLALLAAAEWVLETDLWRIPKYIENYAKRPEERLNANQTALCGSLFGWIRGYQFVSSGVTDRSLRAILSRQAMQNLLCESEIDLRNVSPKDSFAFYATAEGSRVAFKEPYLSVIEDKTEEKIIILKRYEVGKGRKKNRIIANQESMFVGESINLQIARGNLTYQFEVHND